MKTTLAATLIILIVFSNSARAGAVVTESAVLLGSNVATGELVRIDPTNGEVSVIGLLNEPVIAALAFDPINRILYGSSSSTGNLVRIDPATGSTTVIGNYGLTRPLMHAIEYNPNNEILYGLSGRDHNLYEINTETGRATLVERNFGDGFDGAGGMAYDAINDIMYATDLASWGSTDLYTLDLITGQASSVGTYNNSMILGISSLAFDPNLGLFGVDQKINSTFIDQLFSLDPSTGQASYIADLDTRNLLGLTFIPANAIPEPSTLMLALGVAGALVFWRRLA